MTGLVQTAFMAKDNTVDPMTYFLDKGYFTHFDRYISQYLLGSHYESSKEIALALAYMSLLSRQGHIVLKMSPLYPDPFWMCREMGIEGVSDIHLNLLTKSLHNCLYQLPASLCTQLASPNDNLTTPIGLWQDHFYFNRNWHYEKQIIEILQKWLTHSTDDSNTENPIPQIEGLSEPQMQAVHAVLQNRFSILTGGPGTGKTYTAIAILKAYLNMATKKVPRIAITAPTGKAVANLQEKMNSLGKYKRMLFIHVKPLDIL